MVNCSAALTARGKMYKRVTFGHLAPCSDLACSEMIK